MSVDLSPQKARDFTRNPRSAIAVTPSDAADFGTEAQSLYVGGAGDVTLRFFDKSTCTYKAVPAGTQLYVRCIGVMATGTTATNIVANLPGNLESYSPR